MTPKYPVSWALNSLYELVFVFSCVILHKNVDMSTKNVDIGAVFMIQLHSFKDSPIKPLSLNVNIFCWHVNIYYRFHKIHPNATLLSKSERLTPSINEDMLIWVNLIQILIVLRWEDRFKSSSGPEVLEIRHSTLNYLYISLNWKFYRFWRHSVNIMNFREIDVRYASDVTSKLKNISFQRIIL